MKTGRQRFRMGNNFSASLARSCSMLWLPEMNARVFLAVVLIVAAAATSGFAQERGKGRPARRASAKQRLIDAKVRAEERLYRTAPEGKLYLHLYFPKDWKAADQRPAIVFFFGGA